MGVAGTVDFPDHMKTAHQELLDDVATDALTPSLFSLIEAAYDSSGNPYYQKSPYDPAPRVADFMGVMDEFETLVEDFDATTAWEDFVTAIVTKVDAEIFDDTYIDADIASYTALLDDNIVNTVLPRFDAGMRDVNAVMTSAYAVGRAIIEGMKVRDVNKYAADLRNKFHIQRNDSIIRTGIELSKQEVQKYDIWRSMLHYTVEANRIAIVAEKEQNDGTTALAVGEAKWPFELFMYAANLLASIGGGTYIPPTNIADAPSSGQTALGGAMAGASIGAAVGGGTGAALGALLGFGASFL